MAVFTKRIIASSDDAEQDIDEGDVTLTSTDLELHVVSSGLDGIVGMRWTNVTIPQGAKINSATIQFTVDEVLSNNALTSEFRGQDIDDAPTFTTGGNNISNRTETTALVNWVIPSWLVVGDELPAQLTPDLSSIVQEIVNRAGWVSGNDIVIMVKDSTGSGQRTAESFDGVPSSAPELSIDYSEEHTFSVDAILLSRFVSFVGKSADVTEDDNTGTTITVNFPSHLEGDLLIAFINCSNGTPDENPSATINAQTGWTEISDISTGAQTANGLYLAYHIATSDDEIPTQVFTSSTSTGYVSSGSVLRGVDQTTPIDVSSLGSAQGNATSNTTPSVTTTVKNVFVVRALSIDENLAVATTPSPSGYVNRFTMQVTGPGNGTTSFWYDMEEPTAGATGTEVISWTSSTEENISAVFGVRPERKEIEEDFIVDAVLIKIQTETFTVDARVGVRIHEFTVDSILQATFTETFTVDSRLQATFTKVFTVDAVLVKKIEFTINAVLKAFGDNGNAGGFVQSGTINPHFTGTSFDVTIEAVVLANSFLIFQYRVDSADVDEVNVRGQLTSTTNIHFERTTGGASVELSWYVVQSPFFVSSQRGGLTMSATTNNVAVTSVDLAKSFSLASWENAGASWGDGDTIRHRLTSATNLEFLIDVLPGGFEPTIDWEVVEFTNAVVQRGITTFSSVTASEDIAITSVDLSRSIVHLSNTINGDIAIPPDDHGLTGELTTSTNLHIERDGTGHSMQIAWEVIEFPVGVNVQSGLESLGTGQTVANIPISSVDLNRTAVLISHDMKGGRTNDAVADNPHTIWYEAELSTATNLRLTRGASDTSTGDVAWYVIEFAPSQQAIAIVDAIIIRAQRFSVDAILIERKEEFTVDALLQALGDNGNCGAKSQTQSGTAQITGGGTFVDVTIPDAVVLADSFLVFQYRVDDSDPSNILVRGQMTSTTNIHFERDGTGSIIDITWYVVEYPERVTAQRGQTTMTALTTNQTITSVDTNSAFNLAGWENTTTDWGDNDEVRHQITSATNLEFVVDVLPVGFEPVIDWEVVEFLGATVQRGTTSWVAGTSSEDIPITSVDASRAIVHVSHTMTGFTGSPGVHGITGELTTPTNLHIQRDATGNALEIAWYIVEFPPTVKVQSGVELLGTSQTIANVAINGVARNKSMVFLSHNQKGGRTNDVIDDNPHTSWYTGELTTPTNLQLTRGASDTSTGDVSWFVVEFAPEQHACALVDARVSPRKEFTVDAIIFINEVEKEFTIDAFLQATFDETFTVNAIILLTAVEDFTVNAIVKLFNAEETFLIDALLQATFIETFTTDAILKATFTETFLVDALVKAFNTNFNFLVDGFIEAENQKMFLVNGLAQATFDEEFIVDARLIVRNTETFDVNAILIVRNTHTFIVDGLIEETFDETFIVDAFLQATFTEEFLVDAFVQATFTEDFIVDAFPQATFDEDFLVDAFVQATFDEDFLVDGFPQATFTEDFIVDAITVGTKFPFIVDGFPQATFTETFLVDAFVQQLNINKEFIVDSILVELNTETFIVDGLLELEKATTFILDSLLQAQNQKMFLVDGALAGEADEDFIVDGLLEVVNTETFDINAILLQTNTETFIVDSILVIRNDETFLVDGLLQAIFDEDFTVNSILFQRIDETFLIDAQLIQANIETFQVDGLLDAVMDKDFVVNSILFVVKDKDFFVDAILAVRKNFQVDAVLVRQVVIDVDGILIATFDEDFLVDSILKDGSQEFFIVDSLLVTVNSETFLVDSVLSERLTHTFIVDSMLVSGTETETFIVDAVLAEVLTHEFQVDARCAGIGMTNEFNVDAILKATRTCDLFFTQPPHSGGWSLVGNGIAVLGGLISGWGTLSIVRDFFRSVPVLPDDSWTAEYAWKYTIPFTQAPAHFPFSLANGTSPGAPTTNRRVDMIVSRHGGFGIDVGATIRISDGTTATSSSIVSGLAGIIDLDPFFSALGPSPTNIFYTRLEKEGSTYTLSLFKDEARTIHFAGSPISLVSGLSVTGLKWLHTGGFGGGNSARALDGDLFDIKIIGGKLALPSNSAPFGCYDVDALLQEVGQTKTFTVDAQLKAFDKEKTFRVDGNVQLPASAETFDLGAILKLFNINKTFIVDTFIQSVSDTETILVDAVLINVVPTTFTEDFIVDGVLKAFNQEETFIIRAITFKVPSKVIDIGGMLQATLTETPDVNAILVNVETETFELDAFLVPIAINVKGSLVNALVQALNQEESFIVDGNVALLSAETIKIDAFLLATKTELSTVNAILTKDATLKTFLVDAVILGVSGINKTFITDALLQSTFIETFEVDTFSQGVNTEDFFVDAIIIKFPSAVTDLDAILKLFNEEETFTVNANLRIITQLTPFVNAILKATTDETFFINALLQETQTETFLIDAKISTPVKFTVDAFLDGGSVDIPFFVDAILESGVQKTFLIDAKLSTPVKPTVDALIKALGDVRCQPSFLEKIFFDNLTDTSNWSSEINNTSVDGWDTQEIFIDGESVPSDGIVRATMKAGGFGGGDTPIFKTKYRRKLIASEGGIGVVVDGSKVRLEFEYTHIAGDDGIPIGLNKTGIHPENDPNTSAFHISGGENIALVLDSGLTSVQTGTILVGTGIKRFVVAESIGNTVTLNVYSDPAHTSHVVGSPVFVDSSTVDKNDLNFSWVLVGSNPKLLAPATPNTTVEMDEIHIYASPCPVIKVDSLLVVIPEIPFTVGARLVRQVVFSVDAIVRGSANFTVDALLSTVTQVEVDAILSPQAMLVDFFVDGLAKIQDEEIGFNINAVLLRGAVFSVNAIFSTEPSDPNFSLTHIQSIAHIFNGIFDKEFQIDSLLRGSVSVTIDAILLIPLKITVDAILSTVPIPLSFSLTHFQDIVPLLSIDETVTTDVNALLKVLDQEEILINARLVLNPDEEFFIDSILIQNTKTVAPFVDSLLTSLDIEEQTFVSSRLVSRNVEEPLINAILQKFNVEEEFTINVLIKDLDKLEQVLFNAQLSLPRQITTFVNAILKLNGEDGFCNFYPDTLTIGTGLEQFVGPIQPAHESNVDLLIGQEFTLSNQQVKRARILLRSTGGMTVPSVISGKIWRNVVKGNVAGEVVQATSINTIDANASSGDLPAGVWTEVVFDFGGASSPFLTGDFLIGIQHAVGVGINDPTGVGVAQPVISGGNVIAGEALFRREDNSVLPTPDTWKVLISDSIDMVIDLEIVNGDDIVLGKGNQCPRVDSIVVDRFTEDLLVNSILVNRNITTFIINAVLLATDSEDILVNAILSPLKEITIDAQLFVLTITNTETFIVDARLERPNQLKPYQVDARLFNEGDNLEGFLIDAFFKKPNKQIDRFVDAQIQAINQEETFTINAVLLLVTQPKVFVDGFLIFKDVEKTFQITGALAVTQPPVTFTIGAEINDEKERFRVDAQIVQRTDETFIVGARLTDATEKEYFVDSIVKAVNTDEEFLVDTILTFGFQEPFLIGGNLSIINSITPFVNAVLSKDGLTHGFTVNSILVRVGSFIVDGFSKALGDGILGKGNNGNTNPLAVNPFISQFTGTAISGVPVGTNLCGQRLRLPTSPVRVTSFSFKLHRDGLSGSPVGSMVGKIYRNSVAGNTILPADLLETSDNTVLISTLTTNPLTPDIVFFNFSTVEITPDDDIFIGIQLTGTNEEVFFGVEPTGTTIVGGDFTTNAGANWGVDTGVDAVLEVIIDDETRQRASALISAILGVRSKTFIVDGNVKAGGLEKDFIVDGKVVFPKSIEFFIGAILIGSVDLLIGAFVGEIQETVLDVESVVITNNSDTGIESTIGVGET